MTPLLHGNPLHVPVSVIAVVVLSAGMNRLREYSAFEHLPTSLSNSNLVKNKIK
jgi:hypothetical protein